MVEQFYNKNQFLIKGQEDITFQSYESTIATIDKQGNLTLFTDWDYSHTTLKHLYLFLSDYLYALDDATIQLLRDLPYKQNKKAFIQNLIDNNKISFKKGV